MRRTVPSAHDVYLHTYTLHQNTYAVPTYVHCKSKYTRCITTYIHCTPTYTGGIFTYVHCTSNYTHCVYTDTHHNHHRPHGLLILRFSFSFLFYTSLCFPLIYQMMEKGMEPAREWPPLAQHGCRWNEPLLTMEKMRVMAC